jgi:hypothetical protein
MKHFIHSTLLTLTVFLPLSTVEMFRPDAWGSTFFFIDKIKVELTHNFSLLKGLYAIPTLAVKWTFN